MNKQKEYKQIVIGEYVATPIKNAFNSKTAYWLSKANCMVSIYMFTCENGYNEKEMFSDMNLAIYIAMLSVSASSTICGSSSSLMYGSSS